MPGQIPASYSNVQESAEQLRLSASAYRRALELAGLNPARDDWLQHIDRFLLSAGAILIVAGITAFFAWNWPELGHISKFAIIQAGILVAVLGAWRLGLDSPGGRVALAAAAFLVGTLLAVFGQVYQTGADPYGLFLAWAALILPWAVIGRQAGIWLLWQVLLNLTVIMYYTQVLNPPDGWWQLAQLLGPLVWLGPTVTDSTRAASLFVLNITSLAVWEFGARRRTSWMQGTLFPRLIALAALVIVLIPTVIIILAAGLDGKTGLSAISPVLLFIAVAAALYYYRHRRQDLFILTCSLFAVIMVVTSLFIHAMPGDGGSLLILAVLVIVQVAAAAWWLRRVAQGWEKPA